MRDACNEDQLPLPRPLGGPVGGPVGYDGMTAIGIRLALVEPRISAAAFFAGGFVPGTLREDEGTER